MKRERDDDSLLSVDKIFRGEGGMRGRGRGRGKGTRRPLGRGLEYSGYDYSQYDVPTLDPDEMELKADIEVKREMVGAIIGRGGQTVSNIRKASGAQIHIRDSVPGEAEQVIEVKGTRVQVDEAAKQISDIMLQEDESYGIEHPGVKSALILVHIAPEMGGCLIGRGGKNVKGIKEQTGANIRVDSQVEGQMFQTVHIMGSIDSVIEAHAKVADCLRSFDPKKSKMLRSVGGSSGQGAVVPEVSGTVHSGLTQPSGGFGGGGAVGGGTQILSDSHPTGVAQQVVGGSTTQQHQTFVIQAPVQATPGGPPAILVLQPDGTYQPAPVVYQSVQTQPTPTQVAQLQEYSGVQGVVTTQYMTTFGAGLQNVQQLSPTSLNNPQINAQQIPLTTSQPPTAQSILGFPSISMPQTMMPQQPFESINGKYENA